MRLFKTALLVIVVLAGLAYGVYRQRPPTLPAGLVASNGRLEATEVDVATRLAGRLHSMRVREGDPVTAGMVVASMDVADLQAQWLGAQAQVEQARRGQEAARAAVRQSAQERALAESTFRRSEQLVARGFISRERLDRDQTGRSGADASQAIARSRQAEAGAAVMAAQARADNLKVLLDDAELKAPLSGRVLYRLAEPGEVLAAGGKVLTLINPGEMFMTVFLPSAQAGQLAIGSEARLLLDAWPDQPIPARVSFVAPRAQFTPREVETRSERDTLMFRIKVHADPDWLARHADQVKGGMPGMAYLRLQADVPWPPLLQPRAE